MNRFFASTVFTVLIGRAVMAQGFSVDLNLTGGTGRSTGGVYTAEGHIGRFYPASLSGGVFALEAEVLGAREVIISGDVELLASYSDGRLTVLWERAAAEFLLESTTSLEGNAQWSVVELQPQVNTTHFFVSIPIPQERQFFRLRRR